MGRNSRGRYAGDRRAGRAFVGVALTLSLGLGGLALAGCSSSSDSSGSSAQAPQAAQDSARSAESGASAQSQAPNAAQNAVPSPAQTSGQPAPAEASDRRKVSRGEVSVTVTDLTKAAAAVRALAPAHGGFVSSESIGITDLASTDNYGYSSNNYPNSEGDYSGRTSEVYPPSESIIVARPGEARIVLRVAPDQTQATMDAIAKIGTEAGRWSSDTDVEATMVDLESRIATKTRSVDDLRALMSKATAISDIVTLENEISSRTADLEAMKAQQAALSDQVAYSTVTAYLRTPERTDQARTEVGFLGGLAAGWNALLGSLRVLLTILGAVLPFAVLAIAIGYPIKRWLTPRWLARRRRRAEQRRQTAETAGAPLTPPGGSAPGR